MLCCMFMCLLKRKVDCSDFVNDDELRQARMLKEDDEIEEEEECA